MKKPCPAWLRYLALGLICYGHYSGGIYWHYNDDWYTYFEGGRATNRAT